MHAAPVLKPFDERMKKLPENVDKAHEDPLRSRIAHPIGLP